MRILVLTDRFLPETSAPCYRISEHARVWQDLGHEVTVVTCVPNSPYGKVFAGYRNCIFQEEIVDGTRVIRLWTYMAPNERRIRRILDYASFMCSAIVQSPRFQDFDVLVASSPPLFTPLAGWLISAYRNRPWVFLLRDLWPASIGAVGEMKGGILSALESLELHLYRRADRVIAVTHSYKENLIRRGIPGDKIDVVENGVDPTVFDPASIDDEARNRLGLDPDAFLAGYFGTTGMAHGLETLLDAAELCRDDPGTRFLIVGDGAQRVNLEQLAKTKRLENVTFMGFVPHEVMPEYLSCLDVFVVHLRPHSVFNGVIPSKIFEAMAMETPILHAVEGESARVVELAGAGVCVPSGDARAMVDALRKLRDHPAERKALGKRGRRYVMQHYARRVKAEAELNSFLTAVGGAL